MINNPQSKRHNNAKTTQRNDDIITWWRHQMETFSALLAICAGNSPVPGEFPTQRPVTRSFDVYFDLRPNKFLSKQSWGWWSETLSCSLWRQSNDQGWTISPTYNTMLQTRDFLIFVDFPLVLWPELPSVDGTGRGGARPECYGISGRVFRLAATFVKMRSSHD